MISEAPILTTGIKPMLKLSFLTRYPYSINAPVPAPSASEKKNQGIIPDTIHIIYGEPSGL